jgi:ribosomal protein S18 acetylase RimI-like enzyme
VTRTLLDRVLASEEARAASSVLVFTHAVAPALVRTLQQRGFAVERYRHMERTLRHLPDEPGLGREWHVRDTRPMATLMSRAYGPGNPARPFARAGDDAAWLEYARQLTTTAGCGAFMPGLSVVVAPNAGAPVAAALTTVVGPDTGHLAQVVVDPDARRTGLAQRVVITAMRNLRSAGFERVTLLVGEQNGAALRLYGGLGFLPTAAFVSAAIDQPRRSSSAAFATGGASTFR